MRHLVSAIALLLLAVPAAAAATRERARACGTEIGDRPAAALVAQCRQVSLQSSRPCDARRACGELRAEIARSCALLGSAAPALCVGYATAGRGGDEDDDDEDDDG